LRSGGCGVTSSKLLKLAEQQRRGGSELRDQISDYKRDVQKFT
jgi:hypothetical protein